MDKSIIQAAGFALLLAASATAQAAGFVTGRSGVLVGTFDFQNTDGTEEESDVYGVLLGGAVGVGWWFADVVMDYQHLSTDFIDRTDYNFTTGAFLGDFTVFAGFRYATYSDDFSDDKGFREEGPFAGGSYTITLGEQAALGLSAAYNIADLKPHTTEADGYSLKLQGSFLGTPHSVFLRHQRFDGSSDVFTTFEFRETYTQLGYQHTFNLASW